MLGPAMNDAERLVLRRPCASTYCERLISATENEMLERSKNTVSAPTANVTASRCTIVSVPSHHASGSVAGRRRGGCRSRS